MPGASASPTTGCLKPVQKPDEAPTLHMTFANVPRFGGPVLNWTMNRQ